MQKQIRDRYDDSILREAMRRYDVADGSIQLLGEVESYVYEFERGGSGSILRIAHSLRRDENLIQGEVDWINYLSDGGVSVARALNSEHGRLVEAIDDRQGGQFLATAFVKAPGQSPWDLGWTPELYKRYGRLLASMHALAEHYEPSNPAWRRSDWDGPEMAFVANFLPASEAVAHQKYEQLLAHLHALPKDGASYGLIHQDAHGGNFFVDEDGTLTLFDFDDCGYSWFANDIAIALFYIVMDADDWPAFTREFMSHFLNGYREVRPFDRQWLQEIPAFLKLRELVLYAVMHRDYDVQNIDDWWAARFMHDRKWKIERDLPFIDFDFETLDEIS
ncbi:MAG TPA: phosphotransferase [Roseiflexaceae bacterium]|nr:phosphotransferase [Roseiflexaceae bacterium]